MPSSALSQGQKRASQYHSKKPGQGTPEDQLTPERQDVPDSPIRLQDHFLACQTCGVAVRIEDEANVIRVEASAYAEEGAPAKAPKSSLWIIEGQDRPRVTMTFALCPPVGRQTSWPSSSPATLPLGSPWARTLLGGAMDALSFLNPKLISTGEVADFDHLSLRALVRQLGQLGAPYGGGRPAGL
jgi:hypothetical protein